MPPAAPGVPIGRARSDHPDHPRSRRTVVGLLALLGLALALVLGAASPAVALPVTVIDDAGPNDEPGQKDLNSLTVDTAPPGGADLTVAWTWDDTSFNGANTADGCALFDSDNDGMANYSMCVGWDGEADYTTTRLYSCGDGRSDRCDQPVVQLAEDTDGDGDLEATVGGPYASTCSLEKVPDVFHSGQDDVRASCTVKLSDLGSGAKAFLINVCSVPSQQPNADPSDCVVRPRSGFLTLVKVADPNDGTAFAFNLGTGQTATDGRTAFTVNGSGSIALIPFAEGGGYDLTEVLPAGWRLEGASCRLSSGAATGTLSGATVTDLAIQEGRETVCTFTNLRPSTLTLVKVVKNDNGGMAAPSAWTLRAAGPTPLSVSTGTKTEVTSGTYDLSETGGPSGYTASAWVCSHGQLDSDTVAVGQGRDVTCTITNDDQPGRIVVTKRTPTGPSGTFAFVTTGTGYVPFSLGSGALNTQVVNAGTYTVTEAVHPDWLLTGLGGSTDPLTPYACTVDGQGGSSGQGDLNARTATISLKVGDTVTCVFENTYQGPPVEPQGATRTQGFWSTHPALAQVAWLGGTYAGKTFDGVVSVPGIADIKVCGRGIDTLGKLEGGFWANIARTTAPAKRTDLDQARMQLLQQLLAAELNAAAFGSAPTGGSGAFATWEKALCGSDVKAVRAAQSQAAAFNTAGDSVAFTPGVSADARLARSSADLAFGNTVTGA